jgi:Transglycosylase SLT domain
LLDRLSIRMARLRRTLDQHRVLRLLGGRGAVTLLLGTALSVGGLTQALDGVHFLVEKDLDAVRVVKQQGHSAHVVAKLDDGFAGNSVFKLSRVLPERLVSQQISLFDTRWVPEAQPPQQSAQRDVFHTEMARINDAIRRDFFTNAVPFGDVIHAKAEKYGVDPALVAAVVETESRFRKSARSQVGAQGLMQLMPRTGRWMGARNLYDPSQNLDAGTKYLKYLSERFNGNMTKTIAAYNAGEGNVKRYNGVPPFRETRQYVKRVMSHYNHRKQQLRQYDQQQGGAVAVEADGALTAR